MVNAIHTFMLPQVKLPHVLRDCWTDSTSADDRWEALFQRCRAIPFETFCADEEDFKRYLHPRKQEWESHRDRLVDLMYLFHAARTLQWWPVHEAQPPLPIPSMWERWQHREEEFWDRLRTYLTPEMLRISVYRRKRDALEALVVRCASTMCRAPMKVCTSSPEEGYAVKYSPDGTWRDSHSSHYVWITMFLRAEVQNVLESRIPQDLITLIFDYVGECSFVLLETMNEDVYPRMHQWMWDPDETLDDTIVTVDTDASSSHV